MKRGPESSGARRPLESGLEARSAQKEEGSKKGVKYMSPSAATALAHTYCTRKILRWEIFG